ncbi:RNA polymerase sigma factor [Bacillus salitolerans]|uniref:RNA polymerase sigma factor n=1 Tax=Bacillus salitolerans TaxID=1437434 RepID=A0ABW4LWU1_9BACI
MKEGDEYSIITQIQDVLTDRMAVKKSLLVEQARKGNQEAFNELVRLHRAKAQGWAYSVTKDTYLAEDIVQEALFRAFLKLGTLLDINKFTPWLKQIVRNQAYMKVRRADHKLESTFTSLQLESGSARSSLSSMDWADIDQILSYISRRASERTIDGDPEEHMMRLSVIEGICSLLQCLSKREKEFFEAYFFEDLSPDEIAELFNTTKANVYTTISRSRVKVQKERIRICIHHYVQRKTDRGAVKRRILIKPEI